MAGSDQYAGRPEDLEAWQAVQQAIGFMIGSGHGRNPIVRGLLKAGMALNRRPTSDDEALEEWNEELAADYCGREMLFTYHAGWADGFGLRPYP